jgi:formylmethanofuran dehydrogenase subunit A
MPVFWGVPLIAWIQIILGSGVVLFALIKFLHRPKKRKADGYLIRDVHVIVGDGSELFHQNVLIKDGIIRRISDKTIEDAAAAAIDGTGLTLMPGLIDSHIHIQGGFSCRRYITPSSGTSSPHSNEASCDTSQR